MTTTTTTLMVNGDADYEDDGLQNRVEYEHSSASFPPIFQTKSNEFPFHRFPNFLESKKINTTI